MKKFISFVMATVLCVGMTTAVMAAPSAGTGTVSPDVDNSQVVEVKDVAGDVVAGDKTVTLTTWATAGDKAAQAAATIPAVNSSEAWVEFAKAQNVNLAKVEDVVKTYVPDEFKGTVPVPVAGVKSGDTVKALIFKNGAWKAVEAVAKDGVVEVTSNDFCPVLILVGEAPAQPVQPTNPVQPATPVAPKTADVAMFGMTAMAALAGTVAAVRKAKESK